MPQFNGDSFVKTETTRKPGYQPLLRKVLDYVFNFIPSYVRHRVPNFFEADHSVGVVHSIG